MNLKPNEVANGSIGVNSRKTSGSKSPDFTGKIQTAQGAFRISVWALINPQGDQFLSFSVTKAGAGAGAGAGAPSEESPTAGPISAANIFSQLFQAPVVQPKPRKKKNEEQS